MNKTILTATALAGMLTAAQASAAQAASAQVASKPVQEKCYGIIKTAQNDCHTASHSCAGMASRDNDPAEWVLMPKGLCDKLTGASLNNTNLTTTNRTAPAKAASEQHDDKAHAQ